MASRNFKLQLFQYLTLATPHVTVFHYLFTIINGSQGAILFVIFIYGLVQKRRVKHMREESSKKFATIMEELDSTSS